MNDPRRTLVACEIYRDGGSLGAVFNVQEGFESLFLRTEPWDHPDDATFGSLWVSNGEIPDTHGVEIQPSSLAEREWLLRCKRAALSNDLDEGSASLFSAHDHCLVFPK